ncbi:hypothetical protein [Paenibacillus oralis]|nr:hypothetical protein [Paenibacillus oralis]
MKNTAMLDRGRQGTMGNHGEIFNQINRKTTGWRQPNPGGFSCLVPACGR